MKRVIILTSVLLGIMALSTYALFSKNKQTGYTSFLNFSTETKAECKELRNPYCYYICYDKIVLYRDGKEIISAALPGYACHDENWEDPRLK
jgi:hypothetical protein